MSSEKRSIFKDVLHLAGLEKSDRKSPATVASCYSNPPIFKDMLTLNTPDAIETGVSFLNPVWTYCNQYQTLLQRYAAMGTAAVSPQSDKKFPNGGKICVKSVTTKKDLAATVKTNLPLVKPTMTVNHSNNNNSIGNKSSPPRFQCSDCSRSYSTFSGLSKHKQFHCVLQQKKQFGCKFCEKQYSSLGALKMHIRTHTLPCKCEVCDKAFSRPWLLQGHMRTHTGERPFLCSHCGRAFADRSNLRAHLQTHSEVRKYRCKSCQKTFSRLSLLNKHETNGQILPNTVVPPPPHFQVPQFPIMQFQPGQPQYYHQFLVLSGLQMPPPMIILRICNVQSEERMDISGTSTGTQPPQRPPSMVNPDYISPLKREPSIGQPGRDHSGHRQK